MERNIEVQTQALTSLSRDYKIYGQNVYSRYKTGSSRIERELESILRKYAEYGSVTSKARSIQSKLREIERQAKEIEARSSKLSQGLSNVAASYKEDEAQSKRIIDTQKLSVDKISNKTTNIKVAVKLDSQLTASEVGKTVATATKIAIDKIGDIAEGTIEKIKNSSVVSNIKGISKKVSNTLSNIKTSISNTVTNIGTKVSEVATGIKKTVVNFTSAVKDKWESLKSSVKSFTKKTKDFVCDVGKKIADGLTGTFNKFKEVAQTAIEYIKDKKDIILDTLKKVGIKILDGIQFLLDLAGLIPGIGEIADAINGGIYTLRGDALNAALSFAACIPFAGWAATGGKIVGKVAKFVDKIGDVSKLVDKVKDFAKYFDKVKDLGKTVMKYGDNVMNFLAKKGSDIWTFLSKSKVINKAGELVGKLSKFGYDIQDFIIKKVDKIGVNIGEWWMKQAQLGVIHPDIAKWINKKGVSEITQEVSEKVVKEIAEELGEKGIKEVAEEVGEKLTTEVVEELGEKGIKETAEEIGEKLTTEAIENKAEKEIKDVIPSMKDIKESDLDTLNTHIKELAKTDVMLADKYVEATLYAKGMEAGYSEEMIEKYIKSLSGDIEYDIKKELEAEFGKEYWESLSEAAQEKEIKDALNGKIGKAAATKNKLAGLNTIMEYQDRYQKGYFESSQYTLDEILDIKINGKVKGYEIQAKDYSGITNGDLLPRADKFISDKAVVDYVKDLCPDNKALQNCNTLQEVANELSKKPTIVEFVTFQDATPGNNNIIKFGGAYGYGSIEGGGAFAVPKSALQEYANTYSDICSYENGIFKIKDQERFGQEVLSGVPLTSTNGTIMIETKVPMNINNISMPSVVNGSAYAPYFVPGGKLLSGQTEATIIPIKTVITDKTVLGDQSISGSSKGIDYIVSLIK